MTLMQSTSGAHASVIKDGQDQALSVVQIMMATAGLMLASTVGEESGAGLLSEKESHCQAAYDAYDKQEVQVLCSVAPRILSDRAASSSFLEEELIGSYRLERDNLGFYTEHPIPEKQLTDRYNDIYCVSNTL